MVEIVEGKGLPRATFNCNTFYRNVGRKGAASSLLRCHKIVKIREVKELTWIALCYNILVGMGGGETGLPRATFNYHRMKEIWEGKGLP